MITPVNNSTMMKFLTHNHKLKSEINLISYKPLIILKLNEMKMIVRKKCLELILLKIYINQKLRRISKTDFYKKIRLKYQ